MDQTDLNQPTDKAIEAEIEPKWDYTTNEGTLFMGAIVVGLNLVVVLAFALDRLFPSVHSFFIGKPL